MDGDGCDRLTLRVLPIVFQSGLLHAIYIGPMQTMVRICILICILDSCTYAR